MPSARVNKLSVNIVLQTARSGSKSVPNKNITMVGGKPLFMHPLSKAMQSNLVDYYFISTDCEFIKSYSSAYSELNIIDRPNELCMDDSSHHDVMIHAICEIENKIKKKIDNVVVLLGNSPGADSESIDVCLNMINNNTKIDSIQTVSKFNMFNPYRSFKINHDSGFLNNVVEVPDDSNDKNFAGDIMFFNGSFFMCRRDIIMAKKGMNPFPWCGFNIYPYVEECKMEVDDVWQMEFLKKVEGKC